MSLSKDDDDDDDDDGPIPSGENGSNHHHHHPSIKTTNTTTTTTTTNKKKKKYKSEKSVRFLFREATKARNEHAAKYNNKNNNNNKTTTGVVALEYEEDEEEEDEEEEKIILEEVSDTTEKSIFGRGNDAPSKTEERSSAPGDTKSGRFEHVPHDGHSSRVSERADAVSSAKDCHVESLASAEDEDARFGGIADGDREEFGVAVRIFSVSERNEEEVSGKTDESWDHSGE